jgi:hemerythrin superfamily protein
MEQVTGELFDPDDESRYDRDHDKIEQLVLEVHKTVDMFRDLVDTLAQHTDALESEIHPRKKGAAP